MPQAFYENPGEFDGFRFYNLREEDEQDGVTKYQMVNTSTDYVTFGHGKHAWWVKCYYVLLMSLTISRAHSPGRFFAAAELKAMFCHLLLNYDIKLDGKPAAEVWYYHNNVPDPNARVAFRARVR